MILNNGWTVNTLIPQSVRDLIGTFGTSSSTQVDPSALAERKDMMAEGYRGFFRPLPRQVAPPAPAPATQPVSVPASPSLLSAVFGNGNKPVQNFNASGNFQPVPPPEPSSPSFFQVPSFSESGWVSPTMDSSGFYQIPKSTPSNVRPIMPVASTQMQPR